MTKSKAEILEGLRGLARRLVDDKAGSRQIVCTPCGAGGEIIAGWMIVFVGYPCLAFWVTHRLSVAILETRSRVLGGQQTAILRNFVHAHLNEGNEARRMSQAPVVTIPALS